MGGTNTDLGLDMANEILSRNPVASGEKRNRVVIVFTDGVPGRSGFDSNVASHAITEADSIKAAGASVYTVGIFSGADATSAGNSNGSETEKPTGLCRTYPPTMELFRTQAITFLLRMPTL